jgi:UDP-N-acetylglucosamine transferase subunit ALG13
MTHLVVVMVGTDHHPFDRLVDWVDEAARVRPAVRFVVQHGDSKAPLVAEGRAYLPHHEILELLASATAVVCHGGPGTIMDARGAGHVPVCVPRDPALGEHVDGHQQRFAALVHGAGVVFTADTDAALGAAVDRLLASPLEGRVREVPTSAETVGARARLARELDELLSTRERGLLPGRRTRVPG